MLSGHWNYFVVLVIYQGITLTEIHSLARVIQLIVPITVIYATTALLLLGTLKLPYGYYTMLHIIVTGVLACLTYLTAEKHNKILPWLCGFTAIVFNPLIKIHISKGTWTVIDIGTAILILITAKCIKLK